MEGQGFQFCGGVIVPMRPDGTLMADPGFETGATHAGAVSRHVDDEVMQPPPRRLVQQSAPSHQAHQAPIAYAAEGMGPRDVVKAAKARATAIRTELRAMKRLEKELAELDRLIAAAKQKPVALVRNIDHARRTR